MKSKDFIKMLQEEDPSGECYVRLNGGFPYYVEAKEGYWDGAYQYLDEDGNFCTSTQDWKIDVYSMNIEDFVENNFDKNDPDGFEKIKSKLKFDFRGHHPTNQKDFTERYLSRAKKHFNLMVEIYKEIEEKILTK